MAAEMTICHHQFPAADDIIFLDVFDLPFHRGAESHKIMYDVRIRNWQ